MKITIVILLLSLLFLVDLLFGVNLLWERSNKLSWNLYVQKSSSMDRALSLRWVWSCTSKHCNTAPITSPKDNGYFVYISTLHQHLQLHSLLFLIIKQTHFTNVDKALKNIRLCYNAKSRIPHRQFHSPLQF